MRSQLNRYVKDLVEGVSYCQTCRVNLHGILRHQFGMSEKGIRHFESEVIKIKLLHSRPDVDLRIARLVEEVIAQSSGNISAENNASHK